MACCTGEKIDLKEMRTEGQKEMGDFLGPLISSGILTGATPFEGQLTAGSDPAQMAAMNTMMGIGGYGPYTGGSGGTGGFSGFRRGPGVSSNQMNIVNAGPPTNAGVTGVSTTTGNVGWADTGAAGSANTNTYEKPVLPPGTNAMAMDRAWRGNARSGVGGGAGYVREMEQVLSLFFDPYRSR